MRSPWLRDVSPALWIGERLNPFVQDTGSVIPRGFDAYARVFHPVRHGDTVERWEDIAHRNGRLVHREMQLHVISRPAGSSPPAGYDPWSNYPGGSLPIAERRFLVEHLRPSTATPERCWFCVWEGFGGLDDQGVTERVELPNRRYLLASGAVEDAVPSVLDDPWDQSPNLWWPEDRAWCVATEIDYAWTYVGGSRELITALLQDPRLEALEASLTDKPFLESDVLNTALDHHDHA